MVDVSLSTATVFPEDAGTGAPVDTDEGDYVSGGHFGSLILNRSSNSYVEDGAEFDVDTANNQLTVRKGLTFVRFEGDLQVQDRDGDYEIPWNYPVLFLVAFGKESKIPLDTSGDNDVYLWVDLTESDGAYLRVGPNVQPPSGPSLYLGSANPGTGATTLANREVSADGYTDADAVAAINDDADHGTTASHTYTTSADLESGGSDELNVTGLSGDLADAQTPKTHGNSSHSVAYSEDGHDHAGETLGTPGSPITSVTASTIRNKGDPVADPVAFGAVGDGTTDDTEAVQAALDTLSGPGGKLECGVGASGQFRITSSLDMSVINTYRDTQKVDWNGVQLIWDGPADVPMFDFTDTDYVEMCNFRLRGNHTTHGDPGAYAIQLTETDGSAANNHFHDFVIENFLVGICAGNYDSSSDPNVSKTLVENFAINRCNQAIRHCSPNADTMCYISGNISGEGGGVGWRVIQSGFTYFNNVDGFNFGTNAYFHIPSTSDYTGPLVFDNCQAEPGGSTDMKYIVHELNDPSPVHFRGCKNDVPMHFEGGSGAANMPITFDSCELDANVRVNTNNATVIDTGTYVRSAATIELPAPGVQWRKISGDMNGTTNVTGFNATFMQEDLVFDQPQSLAGKTGNWPGQTAVDNGSNTTHGGTDLCIWLGGQWRQVGTTNTFS